MFKHQYKFSFVSVSLLNAISIFVGYLMPKPFFWKKSCGTIKPIARGGADKEVYTFPRGICLKVNVIALMKFELDYSDIPDQHVSLCIKETLGRCPWCSRYRRRNWTRRHEFKSWTRLIAFHIALIPLGKVWIQLFSLQLWLNSRTD